MTLNKEPLNEEDPRVPFLLRFFICSALPAKLWIISTAQRKTRIWHFFFVLAPTINTSAMGEKCNVRNKYTQ